MSRNRKSHYLLIRHRDGSQSLDRIRRVTEEGITIADDRLCSIVITAAHLDDSKAYIDDTRHPIPRPFSRYYKDLATRTPGIKKCPRERRPSTGNELNPRTV